MMVIKIAIKIVIASATDIIPISFFAPPLLALALTLVCSMFGSTRRANSEKTIIIANSVVDIKSEGSYSS
jgi:hypothetical protein